MIEAIIHETISEFLLTNENSVDLPFAPISIIEAELGKLGFDITGEVGADTNGWQVDFWYYYNHSDFGRFYLEGSLWYGDFKLVKVSNE